MGIGGAVGHGIRYVGQPRRAVGVADIERKAGLLAQAAGHVGPFGKQALLGQRIGLHRAVVIQVVLA